MKIIFGGGVSAMRGSLQGTTFSINKNGAYAKKKPTPTNRNSSTQLAQRLLFTQVNKAWGNLAPSERAAWAAVVTGYPYTDVNGVVQTYTAKQLFVTTTLAKIGNGLPMDTTPQAPSWGSYGVPNSFSMGNTSPGADLNFSSSWLVGTVESEILPSDVWYTLYSTGVVSRGTTSPKDAMYRKIGTYNGTDTEAMNAITLFSDGTPIYVAYANIFGTPQAGDTTYFAIQYGYQLSGYFSKKVFETKVVWLP
jgi:hypothetical protein